MSQFTLGEHEAKLEQLQSDMAFVKGAVTRIELVLAEKKGERRVALGLVGIIGAIVSVVITVVLKVFGL